MESKLNNKKILFLCPLFFNYHKKIMKAMESMGAEVDYFDERPSNTVLSKALLRINRNFVTPQIKKHYQEIYSEIKNKTYDYIFICQAEATPIWFLKDIQKLNPTARMVLMLWDSVANKINTLEKLDFFDEVFSFDKKDCDQFGLTFRPLFFDKEYGLIAKEKPELVYDLFFVGTVHSDRYRILKEIRQQFEKNDLNVFYFMYLPSNLMYYQRKLFTNDFTGSQINEFSFEGMPSEQLTEKLKQSRAVVDIQHPKQTGLTMRTIEMLGANKKMITTNADIQHYDFYHPNNICVVDRDKVVVPDEFMKAPFVPVDDKVKDRYSINYFILDILGLIGEKEHNFYVE
ncbi:lipopolysaccharide biosynthesis protein [Bacillus sp. T33-2]|uniref:lipopolysaccharide biosynthesis protein n=1 Tax=Bacillus sp. T33-2 TaxID=2054168 RepID=UPI000C75CD64|nr:lipopolysaccharide biosynthesis protein [Bacillus sp. T33-2]PLR90782.1 lipopolysaccharide biosynthesis protein [Bacillus sp. T33-2]